MITDPESTPSDLDCRVTRDIHPFSQHSIWRVYWHRFIGIQNLINLQVVQCDKNVSIHAVLLFRFTTPGGWRLEQIEARQAFQKARQSAGLFSNALLRLPSNP